MKTHEDVEELKELWTSHCLFYDEGQGWDIESSLGFEEFHDEIKSWRLIQISDRLKEKLGSFPELVNTDNLELAEFLFNLMNRVEELESKILQIDRSS